LEKVYKHGKEWITMERNDTTISVSRNTYLALDSWKSPGQSFNGAIKELLQLQNQTIEDEVKA